MNLIKDVLFRYTARAPRDDKLAAFECNVNVKCSAEKVIKDAKRDFCSHKIEFKVM